MPIDVSRPDLTLAVIGAGVMGCGIAQIAAHAGIRVARVLGILDALQDFYGDPRYRASPWLKRRARLGVSLLTPEA